MATEQQTIKWDEIKPMITRFTVWSTFPELAWFKKAWHGLIAAGMADYSNDEQRHWVYIRAVALGMMYGDYCQLEWDEYCDDDSSINELYDVDDISQVRIGNMVDEHHWIDGCDEREQFCSMVLELVAEIRLEVYDAIEKEFGDVCLLYAGLFLSREHETDHENLSKRINDVFDQHQFSKGRDEAWHYVSCGAMLGVDA